MSQSTRKLAAILHADVIGSTGPMKPPNWSNGCAKTTPTSTCRNEKNLNSWKIEENRTRLYNAAKQAGIQALPSDK